jgi:hypothetical protein
MKYNCNKCGKSFDKKSNYDYHMRRIRPCVKNNNLINEQEIDVKL